MLPFLAQELHTILQTVLAKFIKPAVMEEATTVAKVANIDVTKKENVVAPKKVDIGFASKMAVQKAKESKTVSPLQILEFQNECVEFLQKLASKLLERCPLQYPVVRYLVSLDPAFIANKPDTAISYFSSLLQKLISCKIREPDACDIILQQYKAWLSEVKRYQKEEFANYNPLSADKGLDVFFYEYIGDKPQYKELFGTVKDLLILSHGQSSIERGFSDNKDILSDNMNPETLVAFRRAHDGLKSEKKQIYECVTKNLLEHCSHAYHRYRSHLGEKKAQEEATEKDRRKKELTEELSKARKKLEIFKKTSIDLVAEADDLAKEAEKKNKLNLLVKSNALRAKSQSKRKEVEDEEKNIEQLQKRLKQF